MFENNAVVDDTNTIAESIICFTKCIELSNDYMDAYFLRGIGYYNLGLSGGYDENTGEFKNKHYIEKAINDWNKVIKLKFDYASAYQMLGMTHMSLKNWKEAIKNFEFAMKYDQKLDFKYVIDICKSNLK